MAGAPVAFPLPAGHFGPPLAFSPDQAEQLRALARDRLNATLASERMFLSSQRSRRLGAPIAAVTKVDTREWKPVRSKHDLRVYRRRENGRSPEALASKEDHRDVARAVQGGQPSLLCVGRVEGSLDDVLFGLHNASHEEMQATVRHLDERIVDCTALGTVETAASGDRKHPMHFLGLKWGLFKQPGALLVAPRDVCYLEAMGVTSDYDGRRVGYYIHHSVPLESCPPFDERASGVIRAGYYYAYLFRENTPGFVDVFARGVFDPAGGLGPKLVSSVASSIFMGLFGVVRCAQAKKLTLLASRKHRSGSVDTPIVGRQLCGICSRRPSGLDLSRTRKCQICRQPVCSKCRTDSTMFARSSVGSSISLKKVECCMTCMLDAKRMTDIRPNEPEFAFCPVKAPVAAPLKESKSAKEEKDTVENRPVGARTYSNGSNTSRSNRTGSSTDSILLLSGHDLRDMTHSIAAAGFVGSVMDSKTLGELVGDSDYEDSVVASDVEFSDSEDEQDDDEVIEVESFHRGHTPFVTPLTEGHEDDFRQTVRVGTAYDAATMDHAAKKAEASPVNGPAKPTSLYEQLMALHSSVQETYSMTQANQELMAQMMRAK